jgi:hypothetical protein
VQLVYICICVCTRVCVCVCVCVCLIHHTGHWSSEKEEPLGSAWPSSLPRAVALDLSIQWVWQRAEEEHYGE